MHVLGGVQTDFARRWGRESGRPLASMLESAVQDCLDETGVPARQVGTVHVGNFAGERFAGQSHLGALACSLYPEWASLPASRHEAACASGSMAALAAMAEIEAGRYETALVVGVELMRNVPGSTAAEYLGCAASVPDELNADVLPWPSLFDAIAQETERRYGLDHAHLGRIAELNRSNAVRNPWAQTRDWVSSPGEFSADDVANPTVVGRTRKSDCGRITDGASAVLLAGPRFAARWARRHPRRLLSTVRGWGHRTAPLSLADKLTLSRDSEYMFPNMRAAIVDAYTRAGIAGPGDVDVIETHDCFTITEYVALDHFGLTKPGRAWEAVEDDRIGFNGSIPVNPSGGLIGAGHPVGATGVRILLDAHRQVTDTAGEYQVPRARTAATLNVGGSCSTAASFVVGTADEHTR